MSLASRSVRGSDYLVLLRFGPLLLLFDLLGVLGNSRGSSLWSGRARGSSQKLSGFWNQSKLLLAPAAGSTRVALSDRAGSNWVAMVGWLRLVGKLASG